MADFAPDRVHAVFWDIESLGNVFTNCAYDHDAENADGTHGRLDVYYLTEGVEGVSDLDPSSAAERAALGLIAKRIRDRNRNFEGRIYFHCLNSPNPETMARANRAMAIQFGISDAGTKRAWDWAKATRDKAETQRIALPPTQGSYLSRDGRRLLAPEEGPGAVEVAHSVSDPRAASTFGATCRPATDTDVEGTFTNEAGETVVTHPFDEAESPYLMGYNSFNYDTVMLAFYFNEAWRQTPNGLSFSWEPPSPAAMRTLNDGLFRSEFIDRMSLAPSYAFDSATGTFNGKREEWENPYPASIIRRNMLDSGRHIDVARLNEKQYKTGLKRLLGMLGLQILESDKLRDAQTIRNLDEFAELVAYNASDVVNLRELFRHPAYLTQFENKRHLIEDYPDTVYDRADPSIYEATLDPFHVRYRNRSVWVGQGSTRHSVRMGSDRLTPDSKSAQFAARVLCPWEHLRDIPAVSFDYPSARQAEEQGIERYNVLESCKDFIASECGLDSEVWAEFKPVYDYYKSIEGRNLNDSKTYENDYRGTDAYVEPSDISEIGKGPSCVHYWTRTDDGRLVPTDCYANFSTGGIHGAQMDLRAYEMALAEWQGQKACQDFAKALFHHDSVACRKARTFHYLGTEVPWQKVLRGSRPIAQSEWKDLDAHRPELFAASKDGSTKLHPKWAFTSAAVANHEDFSSYYPNMLRQMDAFRNDRLPTDRYATIYEQKQTFGTYEKDMSLPDAVRNDYHLTREGTKLILNAATGKADSRTAGQNPIRMNNQIMSMRIIGQLFSWRIGQAQALHGAKVISTNTDGLYTVMDELENATILENESKKIRVDIEPEPVFLISKDANNRMECALGDHTDVKDARGSSLACRRGPNPTKSLAHPAIQDWLTAEYLICATDGKKGHPTLADPFDTELAKSLMDRAMAEMEPRKILLMFSNIVASSPKSRTFVFALDPDGSHRTLQHYNRVFALKGERPGACHLMAAHTRKLTPAIQAKRRREGEREIQHDSLASDVLAQNGITVGDIAAISRATHSKLEAAVKRFPGIDPEAWMLIENHSLADLSDKEVADLIADLDVDAYIESTKTSFETNWRQCA